MRHKRSDKKRLKKTEKGQKLSPSLKLSQLIHQFLSQQKSKNFYSEATLKAYRIDLLQLLKHSSGNSSSFEKKLLFWIQKALTEWEVLTHTSRNRKVACLKSFLKWLKKEKHIVKNLSEDLTCPKVSKKIPHYISVDEALHLVETVRKKAKSIEDLILILLLYGGGLRVSEACSLKWSDIDFQKETLRILGKGKKERIITLPSYCFDVLKKPKQKTQFVFGNEALESRKAYNIVRFWGEKADLLHHLNPHALRHSFATHMLTGGGDLRVLQDLLGHKTLQATEKYTHLNLDHLASKMEENHFLGKKQNRKKQP